eukprot:scaffold20556_cov70-Skeletonema_dohrnii-CCMP3373.AAC.4
MQTLVTERGRRREDFLTLTLKYIASKISNTITNNKIVAGEKDDLIPLQVQYIQDSVTNDSISSSGSGGCHGIIILRNHISCRRIQ